MYKHALSLFVLILSLLFISSCSQDEGGGKITKEQDVTIVENRGSGLWEEEGEDKVQFVENLTIGVE